MICVSHTIFTSKSSHCQTPSHVHQQSTLTQSLARERLLMTTELMKVFSPLINYTPTPLFFSLYPHGERGLVDCIITLTHLLSLPAVNVWMVRSESCLWE